MFYLFTEWMKKLYFGPHCSSLIQSGIASYEFLWQSLQSCSLSLNYFSSSTWLPIQLQCSLWTCFQITTSECEISQNVSTSLLSYQCLIKNHFFKYLRRCHLKYSYFFFQNNRKWLYVVCESGFTHISQKRFEIISLESTVLHLPSEIYLNIFSC